MEITSTYRRSAITCMMITGIATAHSVMADTYSVSSSSLEGVYLLDPTHSVDGIPAKVTEVDFAHTFSAPLMSIRFEVSGNVVFSESIDNDTGQIIKVLPNDYFGIGPSINNEWLGAGFPFYFVPFSDGSADNSQLASFVIDSSGNFKSSVVFNNIGHNQGGTFFSSFDDGVGGLSFNIGYDGFGAYMRNQSFSKAGSLTVTNAQLSISTDQFLQPTTVPVPAAAWLFGSGLLGLASVARRKAA